MMDLPLEARIPWLGSARQVTEGVVGRVRVGEAAGARQGGSRR